MTDTDRTARADLLQGLRDLADWLETNPDVPVADFATFELLIHTGQLVGHDNAVAEVQRIAHLIGGTVESDSGHTHTARHFGPRVSYRALAIDRDVMARHDALMSYRGTVEPAPVGAR